MVEEIVQEEIVQEQIAVNYNITSIVPRNL